MLTTVVFDVGETLVDETRQWAGWARWLGVPELGAAKPSPEFFRRVAARAGAEPAQCVHVGDRVDNDVVAAAAAGMTAVHLRRGPWGVLHAEDPSLDDLAVARLDGLDALPDLLRSLHQQ